MVPLLVLGTAVTAGASIYGGIQANKAAQQESALLAEQGRIAQEQADEEAKSHAQDVRRFAAGQSLSFLANGVSLAGSPLLVLDDTYKQGQKEVDAIVKSGKSQASLYTQRANITANEGRASLIGGVASGVGSVTSSAIAGRKAGIW